jgi:putative SOS response-associated peptidase YedK
MCGRYALDLSLQDLFSAFQFGPDLLDLIGPEPKLPFYNQAPSDIKPQRPPVVRQAPVIHLREGHPALELLTWRLIPRWSRGQFTSYSTINAKSETITESRMYQGPWFDNQRCLIPCTGVIEWQQREGRAKQPHQICVEDHQASSQDRALPETASARSIPFAMAGLWEASECRNGHTEYSFTILTTQPNDCFAPLHHRMPVIIPPTQYERWLHTNADDAWQLCQPSSLPMRAYPIGRGVNNPAADGPELLALVDPNAEPSPPTQPNKKKHARKAAADPDDPRLPLF